MPDWRVGFRPAVVEDDLPALPRNIQSRIVRAIEARLATEPARYGMRLKRSLSGLWKMRVGDHRVVYEIAGADVTIWAIGNRKEIYDEAERRWMRP